MNLSKGFLYGISIVGVAGLSYLLIKYKRQCINNDRQNKIIHLRDSEDETSIYFDAETGSDKFKTERKWHLHQCKSIEELYEDAVQQKSLTELQYNFEELKLRTLEQKYDMLDAVESIQNTVNKQDETIDRLQLEMSGIKTELNVLVKNINVIRTQMWSAERNTEKPSEKRDICKIGLLKNRISILEREVTLNGSRIIGMDCSFRTLQLMTARNSSSVGTAAESFTGENRFDRNPLSLNTHCHQPTMPTPSGFTTAWSHSAPSPPPPPPSVISDFWPPAPSAPRPPPPPPSESSSFGPPPPPPPMMMTTGTPAFRRNELGEKTNPSKSNGGEKTYYRIQITNELLKSVVLRPPGQRVAGKRV